MGSASINIAYRPIRTAIIIPKGSDQHLVQAFELSSTTWGGIGNVILETDGHADALAKSLLALSPDAVHFVGLEELGAKLNDRLMRFRTRSFFNEVLSMSNSPLLQVPSVADHYYDKLFQFSTERSNVASVHWDPESRLSLMFSAMFGTFGDGPNAEKFRRSFQAIAGRGFLLDEGVNPMLSKLLFPVRFTATALRPGFDRARQHGVVVGSAENVTHLRQFWNLRASGADVVFWPVEAPEAMAEYTEANIAHMSEGARENQAVWLCTYVRKCPKALSKIMSQAGSPFLTKRLKSGDGTDPTAMRRSFWSTESKSVLASIEKPTEEYAGISAALPPMPFELSHTEAWRSHLIADVSSYSDWDMAPCTLSIPAVPKLDPWASDAITVIGDVRLRGGKIGVFTEQSNTHLRLRAPSAEALVTELFRVAGIDADLSTAGRATRRIVEQFGGIQNCRLLRLPGVRSLFRSSQAIDFSTAKRRIHDDGGFSEYTNAGTAERVFESLLERQAFQSRLWVPCPNCAASSDYPVDRLAPNISCERCDNSISLATQVHRSRWKYRPTGFFANHREHGALPVILTMMRLHQDARKCLTVPSMNLRGDALDCEIDLVALERGDDGDFWLAIGEVKGGEEEISPTDLENLNAVANRLEIANMKTSLVCATTRKAFSSRETSMFQAQAKAHPRTNLILLTSFELETLYTYRSIAADWLPKTYVYSLNDLGENANALYVADPPISPPKISSGLFI